MGIEMTKDTKEIIVRSLLNIASENGKINIEEIANTPLNNKLFAFISNLRVPTAGLYLFRCSKCNKTIHFNCGDYRCYFYNVAAFCMLSIKSVY